MMIVGWSRKLGRFVTMRNDNNDDVLEVHYPHLGKFSPAPSGMIRTIMELIVPSNCYRAVSFRPEKEWWEPK